MVETGELVYRKNVFSTFQFNFVVIALLVVLIAYFLGEPSSSFSEVIFLVIGFIIFLIFHGFEDQNVPEFYEYGVEIYQKGESLGFVPYKDFTSIECYSRVVQGRQSYVYYYIGFFNEENEIAHLETTSLDRLNRVWEKLIAVNPYLLEKLTLCSSKVERIDKKYSEKTYQKLKQRD